MIIGDSALFTDLYQLTMLQTYFENGMEETAVFEMFVRRLPAERNFLLAAGLEQCLDYLENLRFLPEELDWLKQSGRFSRDFIDRLTDFRFTGEVHALPEGTVFFANEPILRVTAPLPQAQLIESRLINLVHFQTLIASKAARCVLSAPAKTLVDFGLRRAHGFEAALLAARASYLAGFSGTATVLAGTRFGIPLFGTMAHSLIMAHEYEEEAFRHFAHAQPDNVVLLIDTYDTEAAARKVVQLAPRLSERGITVKGVRLDSGDLADHAHKVRRILDEGGLQKTIIFCSGDLDEYAIAKLLQSGAPIEGFGIGTHLVTSTDVPALDCVYKLQEYAGIPRRKRSEGKATWPGRKQVYRRVLADDTLEEDCIALEDRLHLGEPLLQPVMKAGCRLTTAESIDVIRQRSQQQLAALPKSLTGLESAKPYPVKIAPELWDLASRLEREGH